MRKTRLTHVSYPVSISRKLNSTLEKYLRREKFSPCSLNCQQFNSFTYLLWIKKLGGTFRNKLKKFLWAITKNYSLRKFFLTPPISQKTLELHFLSLKDFVSIHTHNIFHRYRIDAERGGIVSFFLARENSSYYQTCP